MPYTSNIRQASGSSVRTLSDLTHLHHENMSAQCAHECGDLYTNISSCLVQVTLNLQELVNVAVIPSLAEGYSIAD